MDQNAIKFTWCILFTFISYFSIGQPKWVPKLQLTMEDAMTVSSKELTVSKYLAKNVPFNTKEGECGGQLSIFSFLVNSRGIVDSILVEGNLEKVAVDVIKKNIHSTSNKWKVPKETFPHNECWFVYPFFDAGKSNSCSEDLLSYRNQLIQILKMYSGSKQTTDRIGRILLPPNDFVLLSNK